MRLFRNGLGQCNSKQSFWLTVTMPIGSTLAALFGAWMLTRNNKQFAGFYSLDDYFRLIIFAGAIASGMAALPGTTILLVSGAINPDTYFLNLSHWWMGDALGIIMITPLILVWRQLPTEWFTPKKCLKFC